MNISTSVHSGHRSNGNEGMTRQLLDLRHRVLFSILPKIFRGGRLKHHRTWSLCISKGIKSVNWYILLLIIIIIIIMSFDHTNKWYMHNPAPVLENDTHKLLWDFNIQTDHLIPARRLDLIIINKKKKRPSKRHYYWERTEYWEESWRLEENCCQSDSSEKPSSNADVKSSNEGIMIIIIKIIIYARRPDHIIISKKKRICKIVDFDVPDGHRIKFTLF